MIDIYSMVLYNVVCSDVYSLKSMKSGFSKDQGVSYEERLLGISAI